MAWPDRGRDEFEQDEEVDACFSQHSAIRWKCLILLEKRSMRLRAL
jgi:hypothetical protein